MPRDVWEQMQEHLVDEADLLDALRRHIEADEEETREKIARMLEHEDTEEPSHG